MAYDPDSRLPVLTATIRACSDPACSNWVALAAQKGISVARASGRAGRLRWRIWSETARVTVEQWPERSNEMTVLDPTIAQFNLIRALKATGFLVQEAPKRASRQKGLGRLPATQVLIT